METMQETRTVEDRLDLIEARLATMEGQLAQFIEFFEEFKEMDLSSMMGSLFGR